MNLSTPGDGLFETHVTWEEIEKDMQRELKTKAFFGPKKTAKNLADGIGYMSRIVLIEPDWQNADKQLPRRFVVKILTQLIMVKLSTDMGCASDFPENFDGPLKKAHNTEVFVYDYLIKHAHGRVPIPKIYFMRKFDESNTIKGYIIMEYLESVSIGFHSNVTINSVKEVFSAIAFMEAMSLRFTSEERSQLTTTFYQKFYEQMCDDNVMANSIERLRTIGNGKLSEKVDNLEKIAKGIMDPVKIDRLANDLGMRRVLCHGDLWTANVLWEKNGDEDLRPAAIIDFQCAHMGCPASDAVIMILSCLNGEERRKHWKELLKHLHDKVKKEVGSTEMPYTLQQLEEAYCQTLPFMGLTFVPFAVPVLDKMSEDAVNEEKREMFEALMEKTEYILDDIVSFHERNNSMKEEQKF
ncbi:unnamed protein product [Cylicocyclus nassatus]|uniref:CHK kinase-like domain-containing protein n=1 Tax=Cylicocyclus nassatus TaxID=53992 RepID=A0AA36DKH4_CYLNA|nr:unnamed protein product [Cylicocyclus nassatus]